MSNLIMAKTPLITLKTSKRSEKEIHKVHNYQGWVAGIFKELQQTNNIRKKLQHCDRENTETNVPQKQNG